MHKPLLVYLIDDDKEDQYFFSLALKRIDIEVSCEFANSGIEAIQKFASDPGFRPDYIFIDVNMPVMSGIECLTELRKPGGLSNTPIYLYSTSNDPGISKNCVKLGATAVLQKMSSINEIRDVLNTILSGQEIPFA